MEPTLEGAMALARSATGPLSPHLTAFVTSLIDQSYAISSVRAKAWRAAAFDAWLETQGVELADFCEAHIDQYSQRQYQPRSDCRSKPHLHEAQALLQLLRYLQAQGLCVAPSACTLPADTLLVDFEQFLLRDRGLAVGTASGYRGPFASSSLIASAANASTLARCAPRTSSISFNASPGDRAPMHSSMSSPRCGLFFAGASTAERSTRR